MESEEVGTDPAAAAAQLSALRSGRARMAERAMQPWWYDALCGLLVFGLFGSYSFRKSWVTLAAVGVFLLGLRGLMVLYQRLTGFWVNGLRKGRTRQVVRAWFVLYALVVAAGFAAEYGLEWRGAMVVAGAVLGVGIALIGRWWSRVYIAELREEL
jgi:hypothetical protein